MGMGRKDNGNEEKGQWEWGERTMGMNKWDNGNGEKRQWE